jgi:hypothetical protein
MSAYTWFDWQGRFCVTREALAGLPEAYMKAQHLKTLEWQDDQKSQIKMIIDEMRQQYASHAELMKIRLLYQSTYDQASIRLQEVKDRIADYLSKPEKSTAPLVVQRGGFSYAFSPRTKCTSFSVGLKKEDQELDNVGGGCEVQCIHSLGGKNWGVEIESLSTNIEKADGSHERRSPIPEEDRRRPVGDQYPDCPLFDEQLLVAWIW